MEGIVIILGSPNDERGNLSDISIGRLSRGIEEYRNHKGYKLLCTGGFGEHFNITDKPHAFYARNHLIKRGIPENDMLEIAESHDTVEDALLAKPIIDKYEVKTLIVISSDFHMRRVKHIFERVFQGYDLTFSEAKTGFTEEKYDVLNKHEETELDKLVNAGIPGL